MVSYGSRTLNLGILYIQCSFEVEFLSKLYLFGTHLVTSTHMFALFTSYKKSPHTCEDQSKAISSITPVVVVFSILGILGAGP